MNKLVFVTEARFTKGKNNVIYADAPYNYSLWQRYLSSFDEIYVFARVKVDEEFKADKKYISSGSNVKFIELPYYIGPLEFVKCYFSLKRKIKNEVKNLLTHKFICRVPGNIGDLVINELLKVKKKYALEVVGDPDDVFAPGTIKHPLRAYFRKKSVQSLKKNIKYAGAVLYVTKTTLQNKYPLNKNTFSVFASNVKLETKLIPYRPITWSNKKKYTLLSIGSLEQMYKAPDVVIKALKILNDNPNFSIKLKWLGDGKFFKDVVQLAHDLEIQDNLEMLGNVGRLEVYNHLKSSDVFVLASRTEGLPRAIVEAMSVGLPVVGTNVGGIPELLEEKVLVKKDDHRALAQKITELLTNPKFYEQQALRNYNESKLYYEEVLYKNRKEFYNHIIKNL